MRLFVKKNNVKYMCFIFVALKLTFMNISASFLYPREVYIGNTNWDGSIYMLIYQNESRDYHTIKIINETDYVVSLGSVRIEWFNGIYWRYAPQRIPFRRGRAYLILPQ